MSIKDIFQEGMKEMKRKSNLNKEKRNLQQKEKEYGDHLSSLGKKAWDNNVNIDNYPDLKQSLQTLHKQMEDNKTQLDDWNKKKSETEEKRKEENEKYDKQRKELETKKKDIDDQLNTKKKALKDAQKDLENANNRIQTITKEEETLKKKETDAATPEMDKQNLRTALEKLAIEKEETSKKIPSAQETINSTQPLIPPLETESSQFQKQIDEVRTEQKKVTGELDNTISELKKNIDTSTKSLKETEKDQQKNFSMLGEKLAADNSQDPTLSEEMTKVGNTEKEMVDVRAEIYKLEQLGSEAGSSAFKKMIGIIIAGVIVIILIIVALVLLLKPKELTPQEKIEEFLKNIPKPTGSAYIEPYTPSNHPAERGV